MHPPELFATKTACETRISDENNAKNKKLANGKKKHWGKEANKEKSISSMVIR